MHVCICADEGEKKRDGEVLFFIYVSYIHVNVFYLHMYTHVFSRKCLHYITLYLLYYDVICFITFHQLLVAGRLKWFALVQPRAVSAPQSSAPEKVGGGAD